jgi:phage shock protein PspC (stress-responsive transcriptional regulator)
MNEVTKIHLGRQAFNISVAAHKALRSYLDGITEQVADKDVAEEVELRMAELLFERGVIGEKVILVKDVDYLKKQLGNPKDFKENADDESPQPEPDTKRLFRDTDNAMLAGVSAGLASYFGVDVLIIRVLFVIAAITAGWGILLYIALWLLVPEAKTSSERLQMAGKPVTVDSLKEVVERADVKGAAARANRTISGPINRFFSLLLKSIGIIFILTGLAAIFGLVAGATYLVLHSGNLLQGNLFPIGFREHLLLNLGIAVAALIAVFIVLFGMAIFKRKWPIRNWITGILVGLLFIGLAAGGALAADTVPHVRDRYKANLHAVTHSLQPFSSAIIIGNDADIRFEPGDSYSVSIRSYGNTDISKIKTIESGGKLTVDTTGFDWHDHCGAAVCLPNDFDAQVTVTSPNEPRVDFIGHGKASFIGPNYQSL